MESRFRNFFNTRWARSAEVEVPIETYEVSHNSLTTPIQHPPFIANPQDKAQPGTRKVEPDAMPLRSFSYESCQAGKQPTFGSLPQKGNGPIKLQTSRRLSSGELVNLAQDLQRTLEDIREDGYIVGKKDSQNSPRSGQHPQLPTSRPRLSQNSYSTPNIQVPFALETHLRSSKTSHDDMRNLAQKSTPTGQQQVGLGLYEHTSPTRTRSSTSVYRPSSSQDPVVMDSSRSPTRNPHDLNATLRALRKAEYMTLVELYGSDTAARNLKHYDTRHSSSNPTLTLHGPPAFSPVILEPLPLPPLETEPWRLSQSSSTSESTDSATSSPQRASYVSSVATGQTSIEEESAATRDDIRKMVESMRNSYLSALENHDSTPPKQQSRKVRRSKHSSTSSHSTKPRNLPSSLAVPSSVVSRTPGRQTWHPADTDRNIQSQRRINSHPPSGLGRLSPIEASPPRAVGITSGLERADSSTLGALTAENTKARIRSRSSTMSKTSTHDSIADLELRTPVGTPRGTGSWLDLDPDQIQEVRVESPRGVDPEVKDSKLQSHHSRQDSEDFDELFADELWVSSTSAPSLRPISLCKAYPGEICPSTPKRRLLQIPSIPESPEYTHLATIVEPEHNFI